MNLPLIEKIIKSENLTGATYIGGPMVTYRMTSVLANLQKVAERAIM